MVDIVDKKTRSRMMSGISGKNTKPELLIRSLLHKRGFRFRLHHKDLPGKPDIVLKKYHAVLFVHGCFWHKHDCSYFKWPKTRPEFWKDKIKGNNKRDKENIRRCQEMGWRTLVIWECALRGKDKLSIDLVIDQIVDWLEGNISCSKIDMGTRG